MTTEQSAVAEDLKRFHKSLTLNCNEHFLKNITEILECRKKIAQEIFNCNDEDVVKYLRHLYELYDLDLKELLNLS